MFAPRDVIHFRKMGEALRTIDETYGSRFVQASGAEIQAGTINAISRNPAFFGRWMTQILSQGSFVEKMLLDPAFRESVIQVANKGLGTKASQSALIYMALTASGWRTEEERAAQQQKLAEARQGAAEDIGNNPAFAN